MIKTLFCVAVSLSVTISFAAEDAKTVLGNAQKVMGDLKTVQFSGTGMNAFFGQALTAGKEWPRRDLESFSEAYNLDQKSAKLELVFKNPAVFGGQRQNAEVNGDKAWAVGANGNANPQLASAEERQLQI